MTAQRPVLPRFGLPTIEEFAQMLRAERKRREMTQHAAAEHLLVARSSIARWEAAGSLPRSPYHVKAVREFLAGR